MMKNKVLIKLSVPELNESYDIFVPVNEIIWKVKKLIIKSISDLSGYDIFSKGDCILINQTTGKVYDNNDIIHNVDIRNGTEIMLFSENNSNAVGKIQ